MNQANEGLIDRPAYSQIPETSFERESILLHSCCGPCSTSVVERLSADYKITLFFYNPNIRDEGEYARRLSAQRQFVEIYNSGKTAENRVELIAGAYEPELFLRAVKGLENEAEGGARCRICYRMRLEQTAEQALLRGFGSFSTTLTVSPHKDHELISRIGFDIALKNRINFYSEDFKKKDGYKRSIELSKAYGLYRQDYCGCCFSMRSGDR